MKHEPGLGSYGDELGRERGSPSERCERGGDPASSPGGPPLAWRRRRATRAAWTGLAGGDGDDYRAAARRRAAARDWPLTATSKAAVPAPGLQPSPRASATTCTCASRAEKGFPSSEQLNAHVEAHVEEEEALYGRAEAAEVARRGRRPQAPFWRRWGQGGRGPQGLGELLRPYRCASCDKSYKDPATLRQHEDALADGPTCTICGKKFTQQRGPWPGVHAQPPGPQALRVRRVRHRFTAQIPPHKHMRIHSGRSPTGQVCGGKFAQQRNLISHMKMHAVGGAARRGRGAGGAGGAPRRPGPRRQGQARFPRGRLCSGAPHGRTAQPEAAGQGGCGRAAGSGHALPAGPKVALESLYPLAVTAGGPQPRQGGRGAEPGRTPGRRPRRPDHRPFSPTLSRLWPPCGPGRAPAAPAATSRRVPPPPHARTTVAAAAASPQGRRPHLALPALCLSRGWG